MISPTISTRIALVLASFGLGLATLAPTPAKAQNRNIDVAGGKRAVSRRQPAQKSSRAATTGTKAFSAARPDQPSR